MFGVNLDGLGVYEDDFIILGVHQTKKEKNYFSKRTITATASFKNRVTLNK